MSPAAPSNQKAQTILQAARTVFLKHGFSAATTDMIQQQAGVSKSTVYAHYPTKEKLFIAVVEAECESFLAGMQRIEFHPQNVEALLQQVAETYLDIVLSPIALAQYRVLVAEATKFPELAHRFYQAGPLAMIRHATELMSKAAEAGELDFGGLSAETAATAFANLVRSELQQHYLLHPEARPSRAQVEQWAETCVVIFLRAFAANG
ncbi:TetR/AcrR family transcriptional regulator [Marinimicrobium sp. ARAG 43.8]|uniref:TetR/AcrR family transcriptional regulator n=1 Tax=Marinimicrobium sp. ARAG 43.8 TaxID=3418719 RepID=UPI003CF205A5